MKPALSLRTLSVVLAALALGLVVGYELKASAEKNPGVKGSGASSISCNSNVSVSITANQISASPGVTGGHSYEQSIVCVNPQNSITWSSSDSNVTGFHIFFDESPCEANKDSAMLYNDLNKTFTCTVQNQYTAGAYKYELVVDTGATSHTYFDPILIVGGMGRPPTH